MADIKNTKPKKQQLWKGAVTIVINNTFSVSASNGKLTPESQAQIAKRVGDSVRRTMGRIGE